jgi:predicted PurR-regulated permease PerM
MTDPKNSPRITSPKWGSTTKLIIGLTFVAIVAALLIYFRSIIGPLILAFVIAYLLHPVAKKLGSLIHVPYRTAVNLIYLLWLILLATTSTLTGLAIVQETQSLIDIVQQFVNDLPTLIAKLSAQTYTLGPFSFDLGAYLDLSKLSSQIINTLQLIVGRAGSIVATFASVTASTIGWSLFVLVVSYFVLADIGKVPGSVNYIDIPGYQEDIRRMGRELGHIWNAFLRGQITIVLLVILSYSILLTILGVRYALAIAILAGLARFIPWVGPLVTYIVMGLVTIFQARNYFGLIPWQYTLLVLVLMILLDQTFDNLVSPRIMGQRLGVHPAAVLVVAIIAANLIGIIGLILAAPALASVQLIGRYTLRKMFDLDPWPAVEDVPKSAEFTWVARFFHRLRAWWRRRHSKP